jgi:hypothetical protein
MLFLWLLGRSSVATPHRYHGIVYVFFKCSDFIFFGWKIVESRRMLVWKVTKLGLRWLLLPGELWHPTYWGNTATNVSGIWYSSSLWMMALQTRDVIYHVLFLCSMQLRLMQYFSPVLTACTRRDSCGDWSQYKEGVWQQYVAWILFQNKYQ